MAKYFSRWKGVRGKSCSRADECMKKTHQCLCNFFAEGSSSEWKCSRLDTFGQSKVEVEISKTIFF